MNQEKSEERKVLAMPKPIEVGDGGLEAALDYHSESLESAAADYHLGDGRAKSPNSAYAGKALKALGIEGRPIERAAMERLLNGFHPLTGKKLVQNAGSESRDFLGVDMPFNVPKDVSLLLAFGDEETRAKVHEAIDRASRQSLAFLESRIRVRRGKGGKRWEKVAGLVSMNFFHESNRELDPNGHVHLVVPAVALCQDGLFASIDHQQILQHRMAAGLVGQNALAREIQALGFAVEAHEEVDWSFKIAGVSKEARGHFSQGRAKILKEAERKGIDRRDSEALQRIASRVRSEKDEPPLGDLLQLWEVRGKEVGFSRETVEGIREEGMTIKIPEEAEAEAVLAAALEGESSFTRDKILAAITTISSAQGGLSLEEIEARTDRILSNSEVVLLANSSKKRGRAYGPEEPIYSTKEMIRLEAGIVDSFEKSQGQRLGVADTEVAKAILAFEAKMTAQNRAKDPAAPEVKMKDEQKEMVRLALQGGGQILIEGDAGTGKTFAIAAAVDFFKGQGWRTVGAAVAAKVGDGLNEAGVDSAWTIDSLLPAIERGQFKPDEKTVLFLDEAAMIGSRHVAALQKAFADKGARIVFVGDPKQFQSIAAGGRFFAALQERFQGATTRLQEIVRQRSAWHVEAVKDFASGRAKKALEAFEKEGMLKVGRTKKGAIAQMASDFLAGSAGPDGKPIPYEKKIAIADQWQDVDALNAEIRKGLVEKGLVEERSHRIAAEIGRDKRSVKKDFDFAVGDRIRFYKNRALVGENGEKVQVRNGHFGTIKEISPMRAGDFEISVERTDGQIVRFRTGPSFNEKGKEIPGYDWIRHAYAGTNYGLQGATVEESFFLGDSTRASRHSAYVGASRSKGKTTIYTSEGEAPELARAMSRDASKGWTQDFLSKERLEEILGQIEPKADEQGRGEGRGEGRGGSEAQAPAPAPRPAPSVPETTPATVPSIPRKPLAKTKRGGMSM